MNQFIQPLDDCLARIPPEVNFLNLIPGNSNRDCPWLSMVAAGRRNYPSGCWRWVKFETVCFWL